MFQKKKPRPSCFFFIFFLVFAFPALSSAFQENSQVQNQEATATPPSSFSGLYFTTPSLTAGESHTCGLKSDGTVWCWGKNNYGQLGIGNKIGQNKPQWVKALDRIKTVTAGSNHTCALRDDDKVFCWGRNIYYQLGNGTKNDSSLPLEVAGVSQVKVLTAGLDRTCVIRSDAGLVCWGGNGDPNYPENSWGDYTVPNKGPNFHQNLKIPTLLLDAAGADTVGLGEQHTCYFDHNKNDVYCWGNNGEGQMGNWQAHSTIVEGDQYHDYYTGQLLKVEDLHNVVFNELAAGRHHTCGLKNDGTVWCWGDHSVGQLGIGQYDCTKDGNHLDGISHTQSCGPLPVKDLNGVKKLFSAFRHTCALKTNGTVWCWGENDHQELGNGDLYKNQTVEWGEYIDYFMGRNQLKTAGSDFFDHVAVGGHHTCAMTSQGDIKCWGLDDHGQKWAGNLNTLMTNIVLTVTATPPPPVVKGNDLTVVWTLKNLSEGTAKNVHWKETLPNSLTLKSVQTSQGSCIGTTNLDCTIGNLAKDQTAQVTMVVTPAQLGALTHKAKITTETPELISSNNENSHTFLVVEKPEDIANLPPLNQPSPDVSAQDSSSGGGSGPGNNGTGSGSSGSVKEPEGKTASCSFSHESQISVFSRPAIIMGFIGVVFLLCLGRHRKGHSLKN